MNVLKSLKYAAFAVATVLALTAGPHSAYAASPAGASMQLGDRGTTRGDTYDTKIVVKSGDNAVVGATVTFSRGKQVITKTTGDDGVADFSTKRGSFTVRVVKDAAKAMKTVIVTPSTTTKVVEIDLPAA